MNSYTPYASPLVHYSTCLILHARLEQRSRMICITVIAQTCFLESPDHAHWQKKTVGLEILEWYREIATTGLANAQIIYTQRIAV